LRLQIEYLLALNRVARADRLSGFERPTSREYGEPIEQPLLLVRQQAVAPIQRRPEGLLSRRRGTAPPR
jgi:hypothetical protein